MHTLNFETDPDGTAPEGGGGDALDYEAEPEWTGPTQEQWQQVEQTMGLLNEAMQQQYQPQQQNGEQSPEIPDPYVDPEGFRDWIREQQSEVVAPFAQWQEQAQMQEGRETGFDKLDELQAQEGEFLVPDISRSQAYERAEAHFPEMVARFGDTPKAADAALARGYKEQREYEAAIGKAYYEREMNQLATLSNAPRDLSGAGAQGAQQSEIAPGDEMAIVAKYAGRM